MVATNGLLRIFWPNTLPGTTTPGVMVGWRNSESDLFVVTVLEDAEVGGSFLPPMYVDLPLTVVQQRNVENALKTGMLFRNSPHPINRLFQLCGKSHLCVLGTLNYPDPPSFFNPAQLYVYTFAGSRLPQVYCPHTAGIAMQIILFDLPDPSHMEYMSLRPISLALGEKQTVKDVSMDGFDAEEEEERLRTKKLVEKLKLHSVVQHVPTRKELAFVNIVNQINCCLELSRLLQRNTPFIGPRRKRSMSISERMVESAQSLYTISAVYVWSLFFGYAYPFLSRAFILGLIIHRIVSEGLLMILERRIPRRPSSILDQAASGGGGLALKDISACCQQVHLRLQQCSYYPIQYLRQRQRHRTWSSIHHSNSDYIRFYNSLWLVANDVIIGIALGSYIIENAERVSRFLSDSIRVYTIEGLTRMIRWLMSYPGGLKLNNELAAFLGDLFLWVIEYWSATTTLLIMPHLPALVYFIGVSSFAGASMPIAIFSDLLSLLTLHIYSFYTASARIFNWQLTIIYSLFQLFRGKKRNILRNRIDSCDYDLDQLLLGTILFALLFFLLPTVVVFYLTFASARMAIISFKAVLDTCLACLNHFPLFALMLRLKDSKRIPGGIYFRLLPSKIALNPEQSAPSSAGTEDEQPLPAGVHQSSVSYISLSSTPLSIHEIFAQFFRLAARVRKHYLSPKVVLRLITGRFVPPLGRNEMYGLQYSMLPRQRASVGEVWRALNENTTTPRTARQKYWASRQVAAKTWPANGGPTTGKRWK